MFTAGARYSHYSLKTTNLGGISGQTLFDGPTSAVTKTSKNSAVTLKFSLSYKPNKDVLLYVLASKGFRRSEEHTSELQSLMRISYAVFCLKKKKKIYTKIITRLYNNND